MRSLETYTLIDRRNRHKNHRRQSANQRLGRLGLGLGMLLAVLLGAALIALGIFYAGLTQGLPSPQELPALLDPPNGLLLQPTRLYDRSGQRLLTALENPDAPRRALPLESAQGEHLSAELAKVTVAAEDPTFWSNPGFHLDGLGADSHPALAQRLVSELLFADEPAGLRREVRERLLAAQVTQQYGRQKVLEWVLNSRYYGHLAYGADAAAQLYLGVPASQLDLAEAALLEAVAQAPALNPLDTPQEALDGQKKLLARLLALGSITRAEFDQAVQEPLKLRTSSQAAPDLAPAFTRLALEQLSARYGVDRLERGGLRVITSLDYDLQLQVACALRAQLAQSQAGESQPADACEAARLLPSLAPGQSSPGSDLAGGAVVLDPQSGQILALVGENLAGDLAAGASLSGHAPGSLLTPFVYLAGFTRGMGPASLLWDIPSYLPADLASARNPDGQYHGPVRLRMALDNDYLVPAAWLLEQLGAQNVWQIAGQFGLSGLDQATGSVLFDGGDTTLAEVAQAFGVFANQGILAGQNVAGAGADHLGSAAVLRLEADDGRTLLDWSQAQIQPVVSTQLAYLINQTLSDETARWPSLGHPNSLEVGRPAAAKLGVTASGKDAWAVGYTPQRVAAVWMGASGGAPLSPELSAGLWHAIVQYASRELPADGWTTPAGVSTVQVCDPSGLLPTSDCPSVVSEIFLNGNEPTQVDTLYRAYQINRESGNLATVFTPPDLVETHVYLTVPADAQAWARSTGLPIPPDTYDPIQVQPTSPDVKLSAPAMFSNVRGTVEIRGSASATDFSSYRVLVGQGLNPQEWLQVGADGAAPVVDGRLAAWDTTGLSGLYAVRLQVVHRDQRVETATLQVTVDNDPPQVAVRSPQAGQHVQAVAGRSLILQVDATDQIGVQRVELYVDGGLVAALTQAPFSFPWQGQPGAHTFQAKAYDRAGNLGESETATFYVDK